MYAAKARTCCNSDCNLSKKATQCIGVKVYLVLSILDQVLQQHPESVSSRKGRAANFNKDDWKALLQWLGGLHVHCFGNGIKSGPAHTVQGLAFHDECLGWGLGSQCNDHVQHINIGKAKGYVQLRSLDHIACRLCPWCHMVCRGTLTNTQRVVSEKDMAQLQGKRAIRNEHATTARLVQKGVANGNVLMINPFDCKTSIPKDIIALASQVQNDGGTTWAEVGQVQQQTSSLAVLLAKLQQQTRKDDTQVQRPTAVTPIVDLARLEQQVLADLAQDRAADVFMRLKAELTSALTAGVVSQDLRGAPNICNWQFPNFAEPQVLSNSWQQLMRWEPLQDGAAAAEEMQTGDGQPSSSVAGRPLFSLSGYSTGNTRPGWLPAGSALPLPLPLPAAGQTSQGTAVGLLPPGLMSAGSALPLPLVGASQTSQGTAAGLLPPGLMSAGSALPLPLVGASQTSQGTAAGLLPPGWLPAGSALPLPLPAAGQTPQGTAAGQPPSPSIVSAELFGDDMGYDGLCDTLDNLQSGNSPHGAQVPGQLLPTVGRSQSHVGCDGLARQSSATHLTAAHQMTSPHRSHLVPTALPATLASPTRVEPRARNPMSPTAFDKHTVLKQLMEYLNITHPNKCYAKMRFRANEQPDWWPTAVTYSRDGVMGITSKEVLAQLSSMCSQAIAAAQAQHISNQLKSPTLHPLPSADQTPQGTLNPSSGPAPQMGPLLPAQTSHLTAQASKPFVWNDRSGTLVMPLHIPTPVMRALQCTWQHDRTQQGPMAVPAMKPHVTERASRKRGPDEVRSPDRARGEIDRAELNQRFIAVVLSYFSKKKNKTYVNFVPGKWMRPSWWRGQWGSNCLHFMSAEDVIASWQGLLVEHPNDGYASPPQLPTVAAQLLQPSPSLLAAPPCDPAAHPSLLAAPPCDPAAHPSLLAAPPSLEAGQWWSQDHSEAPPSLEECLSGVDRAAAHWKNTFTRGVWSAHMMGLREPHVWRSLLQEATSVQGDVISAALYQVQMFLQAAGASKRRVLPHTWHTHLKDLPGLAWLPSILAIPFDGKWEMKDQDVVVAPCHTRGHFFLVVFEMRTTQVTFYDSLKGFLTPAEWGQLQAQIQHLIDLFDPAKKTEWKFIHAEMPQQDSLSNDCALFTITAGACVLHGQPVTFSPDHITHDMRMRRMVFHVISQAIPEVLDLSSE